MGKIVVSEFVSLDGVMEGPGPKDPFQHAGWTMPYGNEQFMKFKFDELMASSILLLGRVTYNGFAAAWPQVKDETGFAAKMNSMPKYVVSTTLGNAEWNNSHIIKGDAAGEILKLKQSSADDILVAGSGTLVHTLTENNLVDEYRLLIYPVILGSGLRLFKEGVKANLKLISADAFKTGVVSMRYEPGS